MPNQYTGACGTLTCIAGNDDSPNCSNLEAELDLATQPGKDYYIMVHGFGSTTGNFTLFTSQVAPAASNATCATAEQLVAGTVVNGTTAGGQFTSAPPINSIHLTSPTVWYTFQGNGGPTVLETCGSASNYNTKISVYSGTCGALVGVAANDDFCGSQSRVALNSTVNNQTYLVAVHGFGAQTGDFQLTFNQPTPPVNDQPCGAIPLVLGTSTPFDNTNALTDPGEITPGTGTGPSACNSNDGWCFFETNVQNSVWFSFTIPASGCVSILAQGFDTQMAIYSAGDCNDYTTFTEIAANDDSGNLLNPNLPPSGPSGLVRVGCLTPGEILYVQIDGFNGESGLGTVTLTDCGNSPLTIDAGGCQTRITGYAAADADTNFLVATVSGGYPPYTVEWLPEPSILYENPAYNGIAVQPTTNTTYIALATDFRGCTVSSSVTVNVVDVSCSYTVALATGSGSGSGSRSGSRSGSGSSEDEEYDGSGSGSGSSSGETGRDTTMQGVLMCYTPPAGAGSGSGSGSHSNSSSNSSSSSESGSYDREGSGSRSRSGSGSGSGSNENLGVSYEVCVPVDSVDAYLARPGYSLGPCSATVAGECNGNNPSFPAPPQCETLTLVFNGDFFSNLENTWTLTNLNTSVVLQSPTSIPPSVADTFTFCLDPTQCYEFEILDNVGDGFSFGGSYSVTFMGQTTTSNFVDPFYAPIYSETVQLGTCSSQKRIEATPEEMEVSVYPNPFRSATTLDFQLPVSEQATLEVYDLTGQRVAVLFEGRVEAHVKQSVTFDGSHLNSGFYFYRLTTDSGRGTTGKLILQK